MSRVSEAIFEARITDATETAAFVVALAGEGVGQRRRGGRGLGTEFVTDSLDFEMVVVVLEVVKVVVAAAMGVVVVLAVHRPSVVVVRE